MANHRFPLDPDYAAALVARRRRLGWSQNRLALASNIGEGHLQKLETLRLPIAPQYRAVLEAALSAGEQAAEKANQEKALAARRLRLSIVEGENV